MPKDKYYQLFVISNEYFVAASILFLYCDNIEDYEKYDIVSDIEFEAILPSIKRDFFHQRMVNSVNKI